MKPDIVVLMPGDTLDTTNDFTHYYVLFQYERCDHIMQLLESFGCHSQKSLEAAVNNCVFVRLTTVQLHNITGPTAIFECEKLNEGQASTLAWPSTRFSQP